MATGSVARFDVRRGYGFVIPDDGGEDVFVHQNNILMEGFRYLKAGEHVSYELEVGEKGMKAVRVELLDPRPPEPVREPRAPRAESPRGPRGGADRPAATAVVDDGEVRRLRRKLERLISILVERDILTPGEIDAVDNGFAAQVPVPARSGAASAYDDDDDDEYDDEGDDEDDDDYATEGVADDDADQRR